MVTSTISLQNTWNNAKPKGTQRMAWALLTQSHQGLCKCGWLWKIKYVSPLMVTSKYFRRWQHWAFIERCDWCFSFSLPLTFLEVSGLKYGSWKKKLKGFLIEEEISGLPNSLAKIFFLKQKQPHLHVCLFPGPYQHHRNTDHVAFKFFLWPLRKKL